MKAAQINEYGGTDTIQINEITKPVVSEGKVMVEVYSSSINPFDTTVREGYMKEMLPIDFPATLGGDIAGVVTEVGAGVENLSVGDKVYGQANIVAGNSGAFAEFTVTSSAQVAKMPTNLDFNQAASLPLVGVSSWQAVVENIKLQAGQKIFIHGGSGGIGSIAIQIAKNIGAYIATTATAEGIEFAKNLGADEVIDYKAQDYTEILSEYDAVFDAVGDDFNKALTVLKRGGVAISMIAQADPAKVQELGVTASTQMTQVTTEALNELTKLVESDVVVPQVDTVFPIVQIKQAFEARESGKVHGKVVIEVRNK